MEGCVSLIEEALAENRTPGGICQAGRWIAGLPAKEQAEVREAMAEAAIQHAALCRAIKKRWPDAPGSDGLTRHRKGECACEPR
jgi:hypothetical protein